MAERITPPRHENQVDRWRQKVCELFNSAAYGGYEFITSPKVSAASVSVPTGTIISGDVTDTYTINQTYLQVQEADGGGGNEKFDIQFTFTGVTGSVETCSVVGRYEGNPGHNVFIYQWNYTTTAWVRVTSASQDFPSSTTDESYIFTLLEAADYVSGGETKIRIYHDSAPSSAHDMYIDLINVVQASISLPIAGTYYKLTGVSAMPSDNMTVDATNGTVTIDKAGNYDIVLTTDFSGDDGVTYEGGLFKNGVEIKDLMGRTIGADGDVGSSAGAYIGTFAAGDVLDIRFKADIPDSHMSLFDTTFKVVRLG